MLCVHGKRADGFHDLTSLMAPIDFGDWLEVRFSEGGDDSLTCKREELPAGPENLVLRAAAAFRERTGERRHFRFDLEKHVPVGAGLGGGSGNAAAALKALNRLCGAPLAFDALEDLAATAGSDCPFFIRAVPAVVRGRGERLEAVDAATAERLKGMRLLVFHPGFGVGTAGAYGRLAAAPESYARRDEAEAALTSLAAGDEPANFLRNSFESPVGTKFLAIPALLSALREAGAPCGMSGSGSACFAVSERSAPGEFTRWRKLILDAWGPEAFCIETVFHVQNTDVSERIYGTF